MSEPTRKAPKQERAKDTVQVILDATAQLLEKVGFKGLTTNRLADRSGYSVGTIYQYFPNRESVLVALIGRHQRRTQAAIATLLRDQADEPAELRIRAIITQLHQAFCLYRNPDPKVLKGMIAVMLQHDAESPPHDAAKAIIDVWTHSEEGAGSSFDDTDVFVLGSSIIEVLRRATIHRTPYLGTDRLEASLHRLVMGFLSG